MRELLIRRARVAEVKDGAGRQRMVKKPCCCTSAPTDNTVIDAGFTALFDKVPLKYAGVSEQICSRRRARGASPLAQRCSSGRTSC